MVSSSAAGVIGCFTIGIHEIDIILLRQEHFSAILSGAPDFPLRSRAFTRPDGFTVLLVGGVAVAARIDFSGCYTDIANERADCREASYNDKNVGLYIRKENQRNRCVCKQQESAIAMQSRG